MRALLRVVLKNPIAILIGTVLVTLAGVYAAVHLPVDLFPNLAVPVVNIITHYPAAAPADMELLVSRPIEEEMRTIPGVRRVASTSVQGISQVTVEFGWGITVNDARQLVQAKLARLRGILPAAVSPRLENIGTTLQEVAGYVIYGGADPISLRNIVRHDLAGRLTGVEGVSAIEVFGGDRRAFYVELRPEALARFRLGVSEISTILKKHNLSTVAGYLERSGREYLVRGEARLRTLDDIRAIPVAKDGETPVLLGSIARLYEGRAPRHYVVRGDRLPAVALVVRKQPGASSIKVVRGVEKALAGLRGLLPPGTQVKKYYDQSEIILEAQNEILHDVVIGALLAIMVLYFFLGQWRPTFIVGLTIPLTLLATLASMQWLGLSLNVITMTALTLAIGMIVDDAIIVAENIYRHSLANPDAQLASIEGTLEIAGPDASGTLTTVAAFLPLLLITGQAALFARPFGLTISVVLLVSLALSLTLVPMLFSRNPPLSVGKDFPGSRLLSLLDRALQKTLRFAFRRKWLTFALAAIFLCLAGLAVFLGKTTLLPPIDEGAILVEYVMPPGTSLAESNRMGDALDRIALAQAGVSCVYRRTGSPERGYQIEAVNRGEIMVKLQPKTARRRSVVEIMEALRRSFRKFNGVVFLFHQPTQEKIDESFSGLPALFGVTIYGTEMVKLAALANRVEDILAKDPGITGVVNNTRVKAPQVNVKADEVRLAQYGVRAEELLATLQSAGLGLETTRIVREKENVAVIVKLAESRPLSPSRLERLPLSSRNGGFVTLGSLAQVGISSAPSAITRLNGQRQVTLLAGVKGSIPAAVSRLRKKFKALALPEGYSIDFTGQYKALRETGLEMILAAAAAILLIYLIMVMQFRSWRQPLIILFTVPISLVGAIIALAVSRGVLDISVAMGAVTLMGIAVNNAIVLIAYANRRAAAGRSGGQALLEAASVRLRPILLTSLTTIFALLPTAIGTTVGSRIFQPFAITVIGGLTSGLLGTLVVVPTLALRFANGGRYCSAAK